MDITPTLTLEATDMQYSGERCDRTINKELIPRTLLISTSSVVCSEFIREQVSRFIVPAKV
jgi:hypothetical protein